MISKKMRAGAKYIIQGDIFFKSVIFQILQIFNGLLQTKSVKKCILTE